MQVSARPTYGEIFEGRNYIPSFYEKHFYLLVKFYVAKFITTRFSDTSDLLREISFMYERHHSTENWGNACLHGLIFIYKQRIVCPGSHHQFFLLSNWPHLLPQWLNWTSHHIFTKILLDSLQDIPEAFKILIEFQWHMITDVSAMK